MKKINIFCLILLFFISNSLFAQLLKNENDDIWNRSRSVFERMLYKPELEEETEEFIEVKNKEKIYFVKVACYYGLPFKGEVYFDTLQPPVRKVNYWDRENWVQVIKKMFEERFTRFLLDIKIGNGTVSFRAENAVSMFIIDLLTGDTVLMHNFPSAKERTKRMLVQLPDSTDPQVRYAPKGALEMRNKKMNLTKDPNTGYYYVDVPSDEKLSLNYELPEGTYFAYFINTDDKKLRWAEKFNVQ